MWFLRYASGQTDRQTDRQTDTLIAILCLHTGRKITIVFTVNARLE